MNLSLIISSIIVILVILALFFYAFKNDKSKISVQDIALVALFVVIIAILNKFIALKFPPSQPMFVISFASAVSISLGLLINPKLCLLAGLVTDILGMLIASASGDNSMPYVGFTLTAMLSIFIPCILYRWTKQFNKTLINMIIISVLLAIIVFSGIYLFNVDVISIDQNKTQLNDGIRYMILISLIIIAIIICIINFIMQKKLVLSSQYKISIPQLSLIVLSVEVICHIILTSLWVNLMYGVPMYIGMITRMIKAIIMLPLNIIVISLIIRYIPKQFKQHLMNDVANENEIINSNE
ncbi:MAG: hypothetical protein LBR40_03930 [Bacilli bacterium]|jgi:ECF transporter S component (folate family)|nr:hypothetical protein [Bacilli bacterium]